MPQDTDYKDTKSNNQSLTYRNRLNGWAITRDDGNLARAIVARFRSRSDADGYVQHLRQLMPGIAFEVVFDYQKEE
jgi:hypothetical protein